MSCTSSDMTKECSQQTLLRKGSAGTSHPRVLSKSAELKAMHCKSLERHRTMTLRGRWPAVAALLRCPSEPTILHTFSGPNPTAAARTLFHMLRSRYSL